MNILAPHTWLRDRYRKWREPKPAPPAPTPAGIIRTLEKRVKRSGWIVAVLGLWNFSIATTDAYSHRPWWLVGGMFGAGVFCTVIALKIIGMMGSPVHVMEVHLPDGAQVAELQMGMVRDKGQVM